VKIADLQQRKL